MKCLESVLKFFFKSFFCFSYKNFFCWVWSPLQPFLKRTWVPWVVFVHSFSPSGSISFPRRLTDGDTLWQRGKISLRQTFKANGRVSWKIVRVHRLGKRSLKCGILLDDQISTERRIFQSIFLQKLDLFQGSNLVSVEDKCVVRKKVFPRIFNFFMGDR